MKDWQPIETAPRDGTKFMVWAPGYEWPESVLWEEYDADDAEAIGETGYWRYADDLLSEATDDCCSEYWTHWHAIVPPGAA